MQDFIDVQGASGAQYRFRLWPRGAGHLPTAGNYACVRDGPKGPVVVALGESLNLSLLHSELPKSQQGPETHIFTRLNVARATRSAEHADMAAHHANSREEKAAKAGRSR